MQATALKYSLFCFVFLSLSIGGFFVRSPALDAQAITNNARCVLIDAPDTAQTGEGFFASVHMQNTGTKLWTSDPTPHKLEYVNPGSVTWWGIRFVGLPQSVINPGETAVFTFFVTAPDQAGIYPFDWQMTEINIESFFGEACTKSITVGSAASIQAPSVSTSAASALADSSATLNGSVTPNGASSNAWFEWGLSGALGNVTSIQSVGSGGTAVNISGDISGLTPGTTYFYRVVGQNSVGTTQGLTLSLVTTGTAPPPSPVAPIAFTGIATNISQTVATLNGLGDPRGQLASGFFEWGVSSAFGNTTAAQSLGSGSGDVQYSLSIIGLDPGATYFYRAVVQNASGTGFGSTVSFATNPPTLPPPGGGGDDGPGPGSPPPGSPGAGSIIFTDLVSESDRTSARLNGRVNPNGASSNVWFEWGPSIALGNVTPSVSVGNGSVETPFSQLIFGLLPNTTYFYRAMVENSSGITPASIVSFSTVHGFRSSSSGFGSVPSVATDAARIVSTGSVELTGWLSPNGGDTESWFDWGDTSALGLSTQRQLVLGSTMSAQQSVILNDLRPNSTYFYRLMGKNQFGTTQGAIRTFFSSVTLSSIPQGAPEVTTTAASLVTSDSAKLNGAVNPNGALADAWFEWGRSSSLGNRTVARGVGNGSHDVIISDLLTSLAPGTTYFYKAVARSATNEISSAIGSFTTKSRLVSPEQGDAPLVVSHVPLVLGEDARRLNGSVSPQGAEASVWFEWGVTPELGSVIPPATIDGEFAFLPFFADLPSLADGTYYFRALASTVHGTSRGSVLSFSVPIAIAPPAPVPAPVPVPESDAPIEEDNFFNLPDLLLTPAVSTNRPIPQEEFEYLLAYQNISDEVISNVRVVVNLPSELTFRSFDSQPIFRGEGMVEFRIGEVPAFGEGLIRTSIETGAALASGTELIISAEGIYTDPSGEERSIKTFRTLTIKTARADLSGLAALFGVLDAVPLWFIFLLVGLMVIFYIFRKRKKQKVDNTHNFLV